MIYSIKVDKNTVKKHASFHYISDIKTFPDEISFSSGINIIIGKNGTGKSTILNIIRNVFLIGDHEYHSPINISDVYNACFNRSLSNNELNSIDVIADYRRTVFSYPDRIPKKTHECKSAADMANIYWAAHSSSGENRLKRLDKLFSTMFGDSSILQFPHDKIATDTNKYIKSYKEYMQLHNTPSNHYTVLFDEPDMNLDIDNIDQIVAILSTQKEMTQVIAVVHNPLIINILSKYEYINFIEMTPGYLKKIKGIINKYTRKPRQYEKF